MSSKKNAPGRAATAANQGLSLGIDEIKSQFGDTQSSFADAIAQFLPFLQAGTGQLGALEQGATVGGLDERLGEITSSDTFGNIVDERTRATQGALGAGGLTRSGTAVEELSAIPQDVALAIEEMLTGRSKGLADTGLAAAGASGGLTSALGGIGSNVSSAIASLLGQQGENTSSGILGKAQAQAAFGSQVAGLGTALLLSDPRLKVNIEPVAELADLTVYQWDWHPELEGSFVFTMPTTGFLTTEVEEKYPQHVFEFGGYKGIKYIELLDEMDENRMAA